RHESQAAGPDALDDGSGPGVGQVVVPEPAPPDQDVGIVERRVGQAGLGLVESGQADLQTLAAAEVVADGAVDIVGIDRLGRRPLAPDADSQRTIRRLRWRWR